MFYGSSERFSAWKQEGKWSSSPCELWHMQVNLNVKEETQLISMQWSEGRDEDCKRKVGPPEEKSGARVQTFTL